MTAAAAPGTDKPVAPMTIVSAMAGDDDEAVLGCSPIYVWELPVRLTHWAIFISIVALGLTGLYIHAPYLVPSKPVEASSMMATVRFWHEIFAILFTISIGVRFYWGFVGNSFSSWRQIIPHRRDQLHWLKEMGKYYSFRRRHPAPYAGHNHLAGLAYTVVSVGMFAQVLSGLLLFGWIMPAGPLHALFGWGNALPGGIQTVRTFHYILTFLFTAFAIHHVYSAILVDIEERTGVMSSMFSGYKNIRPSSSLEALGLVGVSPEEDVRSKRLLDAETAGKKAAEKAVPEATREAVEADA
ncbi:MAG: Ni/Fe-hydrogenase, b-type cytochrome subunit [Chloroflexota bacterium]